MSRVETKSTCGRFRARVGNGRSRTAIPTIRPGLGRRRELLFVSAGDLRIMRAPYVVEGDSFRAEKPQLWSDGLIAARPQAAEP